FPDVGFRGNRTAAEGFDSRGISRGRRFAVSGADAATVRCPNMETAGAVHRDGNRAGDRGAMACAGNTEESAVLRFYDAQRERVLSRLFLVLLHQRARAAIPQPTLSAGLQH